MPLTPPWIASADGYLVVARDSTITWWDLDLDRWSDRVSTACAGNPPAKGVTVAIQEPKGGKSVFQRQPYVVRNGSQHHLGAVKVTASTQLWQGVQAALTAGHLVMLTYTSDGGALCVTVKDGDERLRSYGTTVAEMDLMGQELMQLYA